MSVARPREGESACRAGAATGAAVVAWLACAGVPALVAAFGAVGARTLAQHAYMFPAFAAFLGLSVWLLWRTGWPRGVFRPFRLALLAAVLAVAAFWLSLVGNVGFVWLWQYLGIAGVVAASVGSFALGRRPGNCRDEMIIEIRQRERARLARATPGSRRGYRRPAACQALRPAPVRERIPAGARVARSEAPRLCEGTFLSSGMSMMSDEEETG